MCKSISIKELENSETKEIKIFFDDIIEGLKTKDNIKAELTFKDLGEFVNAKGHVSGIAILECDLCLNEYEYKLDIYVDEMYAKNSYLTEAKQETEIKEDGFVIDLNGSDEIDIKDLIYQTVLLEFPNKKVCDINCNGGDIFIRENEEEENLDPRMSIFKDIKIN